MKKKSAQAADTHTNIPFYKVILVIVLALGGFILTSAAIGDSTLQYATPKKYLHRTVLDESDPSGKTAIRFSFPIHSMLPVDTIKHPEPIQREIKNYEKSRQSRSHDPMLYHENPYILVWLILISAMMGFATGACPVFIAQIQLTMKKFELDPRLLVASIVCAVFFAGLIMLSNQALPGYYKPEKIIDDLHIVLQNGSTLVWVVFLALLFTSPSFVLIFLLGFSSYKASQEKDLRVAVQKIQTLNSDLQRTLKILTVIIVFSVLTSCTLGMCFRSAVKIEGFDIYPAQIGYIYGAYFTVFLCIIYVPVHYYIRHQYKMLKEKALEPQRKEDEAHNVEALFNDKQLEGNVMDSLKLVLTLLLPLLSSFLPQGLNLFS